MTPDVSVIVLCRNEIEDLRACLEVVLAQSFPGRVDVLVVEVTAEDATGRRWSLWYEDTDPAGPDPPFTFDMLQYPDLAGLPALQLGAWSIHAEARLYVDLLGAVGNFVLAERIRQEVTYSRSAPETVTVQ